MGFVRIDAKKHLKTAGVPESRWSGNEE